MKYYDQTTEKLAVLIESTLALAATGVKTSCQVLTESASYGANAYMPLLEAVDEAAEGTAELQESKRTVSEKLKSIKDSKAVQKIKAAIDKIVNWILTKAKSLKAMALGRKALESVETQVDNATESAEQEGDAEKVSKLKQLKSAIKSAMGKVKAKFAKKESDVMTEAAEGEFEDSEANMFENPLEDPSEADGEETNDPEVNAMASGGDEEDTEDFQESETAEQVINMIESAVRLSESGAILTENALLEAAWSNPRLEKFIPVLEATEILIEASTDYNKRAAAATKQMKENQQKPKNAVQTAIINAPYNAKEAAGKMKVAFDKFKDKIKEFIDKVLAGIKNTKVYSVLTGWAANLKTMFNNIFKKQKEAEAAGDKETAGKFKELRSKLKGLWTTISNKAKTTFGKKLENDVPAPESV